MTATSAAVVGSAVPSGAAGGRVVPPGAAGGADHEQVVFCQDRASGLRAIIAIHSTVLGPALGGVRALVYPDEESALTDVLRLARGASYRNALAGLDLGGGAAVIVSDPGGGHGEARLRAFGRFVQSLSGRYVAAGDMGTACADVDVIARETPHVAGRGTEWGGAGDPAGLTALGVLQGLLECAQAQWGSDDLAGRRVGVEGAGRVGRRLVRHLVEHGATAVVYDADPAAVRGRALPRGERVEVARSREEFLAAGLDAYAPCAVGGTLTEELAATLDAEVVCGAADNQLAGRDAELLLARRGIRYAPDYVVNAGGVLQLAEELGRGDQARARARTLAVRDTLAAVFRYAEERGITPGAAADWLAEQRMASVGALRGIHLAG